MRLCPLVCRLAVSMAHHRAENLFCAGSYQKILEAIAKPALDAGVVCYGKNVVQIQRKTGTEETVRVLTEDGERLQFDEVVCTAPLGWLKRHPNAFDPPLPPRLRKAVDSIGYGCLEKVSARVPGCHCTRLTIPLR